MKETKISPQFTEPGLRVFLFLGALLFALFTTPACGVKQTTKVQVPQAILQAKTAGFDELLSIIRGADKIQSLACNDMRLTLTSSKKIENGEWEEKYRTVKGYILLKRPDATHLVLLIPITQSKLVDVLSVGDNFTVWNPRKNELYKGLNSAKELIADDPSGPKEFSIPIRGNHIFEAIFPQSISLNSPGVWVSKDEQKDDRSRYYILTFAKEGTHPRLHTIRKIWIERAGLTIARQQVYAEEGQIVSDITYSDPIQVDGVSMPQQMHIDRPMDGYTLDLSFKNWRINPDLPEDAFQLQTPPGAKEVILREKSR